MVTKEFLPFSKLPKNRTTMEVRIHASAPSSRRPCLALHRSALPVHCRQPLECISACRRDELRVAVNVTSKRRFTSLRSIPEPREGACGEQKSQLSTFAIGADRTWISCGCCWNYRTACDFPLRGFLSRKTTPRGLHRAAVIAKVL